MMYNLESAIVDVEWNFENGCVRVEVNIGHKMQHGTVGVECQIENGERLVRVNQYGLTEIVYLQN